MAIPQKGGLKLNLAQQQRGQIRNSDGYSTERWIETRLAGLQPFPMTRFRWLFHRKVDWNSAGISFPLSAGAIPMAIPQKGGLKQPLAYYVLADWPLFRWLFHRKVDWNQTTVSAWRLKTKIPMAIPQKGGLKHLNLLGTFNPKPHSDGYSTERWIETFFALQQDCNQENSDGYSTERWIETFFCCVSAP